MSNRLIQNNDRVVIGPRSFVPTLDFLAVLVILIGGIVFLWNAQFWGNAYVGKNQFGDAEFWWNGAVHFAQGIFSENPGKGYRPGYFVMAGAALPILGTNFLVFHKFFAILFLTGASALFLTLRDTFGRLGAFCSVALFVFNPYTAEWVATSTTDALGLLLHLVSLIFLIRGFRTRSLQSLAGFGFSFALATLTRPLITPFIAVAFFLVLIGFSRNLKTNLRGSLTLGCAFYTLIFCWTGIQKLNIGKWSVSTNDVSALYAASDPKIQVWNGEMGAAVDNAARADFNTPTPTPQQVNEEFWKLTRRNYLTHWRYHLERIAPHFWTMASFSPLIPIHGSSLYRTFFYGMFLLGCVLLLVKEQNALSNIRICFAVFLFMALAKFPIVYPITLLAGVAWCTLEALLKKAVTTGLIISLYWVAGIFTLALVGGTIGSPPQLQIDALGYRLGSQIFFTGDIAALYLLYRILGSPELETKYEGKSNFNSYIRRGFYFGILSFLLIEGAGLTIVSFRWLQRQFSTPVPYPSLNSTFPVNVSQSTSRDIESFVTATSTGKPVWVTGMVSDFIWNFKGQDRSQALFYLQKNLRPIDMHPNGMTIEFPEQLKESNWTNIQGAFFLRSFPEDLPFITSTLPYYTVATAVRMFIPLDQDHQHFDLEKAVRFPLKLYASQLHYSKLLTATEGSLELESDSGDHPFQRRFRVLPASRSQYAQLRLDLSPFRGDRYLQFSWEGEGSLKMKVNGKILATPGSNSIFLNLTDPKAKVAEMEWSNLHENGVFVYEMNVSAEDMDIPESKE